MRIQTTTCRLVPESQRLSITAELFGSYFPMRLEPTIYNITGQLATAYTGGHWDFLTVSTRDGYAFYMRPSGGGVYAVESPNGWSGVMSADALGITACLYAYSHLSFSAPPTMAGVLSDQYHSLREYVMGLEIASAIIAACD